MPSLEDLLAREPAPEGPAGTIETLRARKSDHPARLTKAAMARFGADDSLQAIEIVLDGVSAGYLPRRAAYGLADSLTKSIGMGDHGTLPGIPDYKLIVMECRSPGCGFRLSTLIYDEDEPQSCPHHPNVK